MLDIKFVRENPDAVDKSCASRQNAHWDRERFFELDEERRSVIAEVENLQAERNAASKEIGLLMRDGKKDEAEAAKAKVTANKQRIADLNEKRTDVEKQLFDLVAAIPNIPHESVPYGVDDSDNPEVRKWGEPTHFDFEPKAHWDLGPSTGMIDFERGIKLAGTRFYLLGGAGALMERALINFFIDTHVKAGFKEWWPPVITNYDSLFGTGQLPKFDEDLYHVSGGMYLIPTAEVMLTNIHRGELLDGSQLPLWYTAFTPCFREEAGSAGRDTRGIINACLEKYPKATVAEEICAATRMRQEAVMNLTDTDCLIVVGDPRSNNSNQLKRIAFDAGIKEAFLIGSVLDLKEEMVKNKNRIAVTSGSSTPNSLTNQVIDFLKQYAIDGIWQLPSEALVRLL